MTITLTGYRVIEKIYSGSKTLVYRLQRLSDQKSVIIKLLKREYPSLSELVKLGNDYRISKNLNLPGIVKPLSLEHYRKGLALVMEDFGAVSLKDYTSSRLMSLKEFFQIAIKIVQILEQLYSSQIIHHNINPRNLLINSQTKQVKLTDFSLASLLPRETQFLQSPKLLPGKLAYISPEQTGRMNRGIDYRSDFYSVGVTFYELLTGQLPFQSNDPMELIYWHLARQPNLPTQINSTIPEMVSQIVMKLMAKTPEERYQSAYGIRQDLEICWQQWETNQGRIAPFILGERDICDRFVIAEKLYGREAEVATLLAAFDRVAEGTTEMMLVAGFSGIGKTALINEVYKPIAKKRGYSIKGKFDRFRRNSPFWALVQALRDLMGQLLAESQEQLHRWQEEINTSLGNNAQVLIEVIPELELLLGKQPPVLELEPAAAQNRFNLLFEKFIKVFTTAAHPLVIFLDDLQWADLASLKLIQVLMRENLGSLLLLGAYRDNEVWNSHPLMLTLEEIGHTSVTLNQINLAPLDRTSLNQLIADTLSCTAQRTIPLTELVYEKTQGNPFFATQFLKSLYQEGLIDFNFGEGCWQCDLAKVKTLSVSNDVVEFMAQRLQKLPEETQTVLKLAACIGNQFDLAPLAIVCEQSQAETAANLWRALQEGLVLPISEIYKFFQGSEASEVAIEDKFSVPYKFLHDRVQQASYSLIPDSEKQSTHLKIGQLLLNNTNPKEWEEKIFEIVNQLNMGLELISEPTERYQLIRLNLIAGRKAKDSTAFAAAFNYFSIGLKLLALDCWDSQYDLTLALHTESAEAAYLSGNFERQLELVELVLQRARSLLDKVKAYEIKILASVAQSQPLAAVKTALEVLRLLGFKLPHRPSKLRILLALLGTKLILLGKKPEDLINMKAMTDPDKLAAMEIGGIVGSPAYNSVPQLMPLLALKSVKLSVTYGNSSMSAYGYASYGVTLCGGLGDIDSGYGFGQLALNLLEKFNAKKHKARTFMVFNNFIRHWKEHVREGLKPLLEAYSTGLETGDIEFAAYCTYIYCYHSYFIGKELVELCEKMVNYIHLTSQLKQETALNLLRLYRQVVLNLLGEAENSCHLIGESFDEQLMLPQFIETNHQSAIFHLYCNKLILCYLFGQFPQALENAATAQKYLDGVRSTLAVPLFYFYTSLAQLAGCTAVKESEKKRILRTVNANQRKMKKWADAVPMNHLHKFYLVEAERYRVLAYPLRAMEYYDRAIALAKENNYLNEQALANELAGKFYLDWGKEKIAQVYLIDAYYNYACWGAQAKLEDLAKRYAQVLAPILSRQSNQPTEAKLSRITNTHLTSSIVASSEILDLATVAKASQALGQEIQLDRLISKLMQIVISHAGAQIGYLLLLQGGKLRFRAQCVRGQCVSDRDCNLQSVSVFSSQEIPLSVINYVQRTQETVVIHDATSQTRWSGDPYIIQKQPKSIFCGPLLNQGQLIGIVYLENNLTTGAFTRDRLQILQVLCSQAAIALKNGYLYHHLQSSNQALQQSLQELQQTQIQLLQTQEKLRHDAFHDSLTGLPNRAWFMNLLSHAIQLALRHPNYLYAVLFLDLDRFKLVNDSLGHLVGDELLKSVATRLRECLRASDTVARLGGDEFAILLEEMKDIQEATGVAQRIQQHLRMPFNLNAGEVRTGTSIGIALGNRGYQRPEEVLRDADAAMYHAKALGKGSYALFDPGMQTRVLASLKLETDLRRAIEQQEFCLYYQPIISLATGRLSGFEALVRWYHSSRGWVSPLEFIPVAEETGLIQELGWWILESACRQLQAWLSQFPQSLPLVINVNLSSAQLKQADLLDQLSQLLSQTDLPSECLKLEITESCILETNTLEAKRLKQLKDLGVKLCIDDFGTGYSSLSRLHEFPIDTLKLDRSFVSSLDVSGDRSETVKMIITLAHSLGMDVVAEGIETTTQLEQLLQLDCNWGQGYLFSQPVDSQSASQLLVDKWSAKRRGSRGAGRQGGRGAGEQGRQGG